MPTKNVNTIDQAKAQLERIDRENFTINCCSSAIQTMARLLWDEHDAVAREREGLYIGILELAKRIGVSVDQLHSAREGARDYFEQLEGKS